MFDRNIIQFPGIFYNYEVRHIEPIQWHSILSNIKIKTNICLAREDVRIDVSPQSIWKRKKYIDDEADNNVEVTEDN